MGFTSNGNTSHNRKNQNPSGQRYQNRVPRQGDNNSRSGYTGAQHTGNNRRAPQRVQYPTQQPYGTPPTSMGPRNEQRGFQTEPKKHSRTALQYVCIAIIGILVVLFIIKAGQIVVNGIGPAIQAFQAVMNAIFNRFIEALIGAVIIYILVTMFLGRYLPLGIKRKIIPICIVLIMLYSVSPVLSTAIGELLIILAGLAILVFALR